jgi:hypothetical protein
MAEPVHDAARLKELQALPLDRKIQISQARIIEWYQKNNGNVCVSFSGGKDSTVLLHLVRTLYPDVPAVFSNTGLEYPEIQKFVRTFPNVDIVVPKMRFDQVISTYGYPLIGKEVAEAIHYARKIRSHSVHVEREREQERTVLRKRRELLGIRSKSAGGALGSRAQTERPPRGMAEAASGRSDGNGTSSTGFGRQAEFKRTELRGGRTTSSRRERRRTEEQSSWGNGAKPG